jgi:hypothetical protein
VSSFKSMKQELMIGVRSEVIVPGQPRKRIAPDVLRSSMMGECRLRSRSGANQID